MSAKRDRKILLPKRSALFQAGITDPGYSDLARHAFACPLLPFLHEDSQRFAGQLCTTEEVHVQMPVHCSVVARIGDADEIELVIELGAARDHRSRLQR